MKRFSILALCLIAAYAMGTVVAGGVYAGTKTKFESCQAAVAEAKGKLEGLEEEQKTHLTELKENGVSAEKRAEVKEKYEAKDEVLKEDIGEKAEACKAKKVEGNEGVQTKYEECLVKYSEAKGKLAGQKEEQKTRLKELKEEHKTEHREKLKANYEAKDAVAQAALEEKKEACKTKRSEGKE